MSVDECSDEIDEPLVREGSENEQEGSVQVVPATRGRGCCSLITVEPAVFAFAVYMALSVPMTQQYVFARVALDYNSSIEHLKNITSCGGNSSDPDYILHQNVQHDTSSWWAVLNAAQLPFACLATLFLGSYSDKGGRKPGLILPIVGALLKAAICVCVTSLELPKEVLFAAFIIEGIFGSFGTFLMSTFAYISDVTGHTNRALRIIIVESALGVGIVGGSLFFSLLPIAGFTTLYVALAAVLFLTLVYVIVLLKESRVVVERAKICSSEHIKLMVKVYTVNDAFGRRIKLILGAGILLFGAILEIGRGNVLLLYVQNSVLCWSNKQMSINGAVAYVLNTLGSICITKLLQNKLQDLGLMMVGGVSSIAEVLLLAFSTETWMIYASVVIGMFGRMLLQLLRSFCSKVVSPDEQGAMYAAYAILQVGGGLIGSVIFTTIYNVTLDWWSGFVFIIAAIIGLICIILNGIAMVVQRNVGFRPTVLIEEVVA